LISLKIGIDGLPISKSSNLQFWPILGKVDQSLTNNVFVISLFYGASKPQCLESFLQPFVEEMEDLESNGILFNGIIYTIRISRIIADAPARSFIKGVKSHNAYFGCER
jgi:hypothetical protein